MPSVTVKQKNVWLVCGEDSVLVQEKKRELLTRYFKGNPPEPAVFDASGNFEEYRNALSGQSLFSAETALVIENPPFLKRALKKEDEKPFAAFLESLRAAPAEVFTVITADGKPDKRLKAVKELLSAASVIECGLMKPQDGTEWMERYLYDRGKSLDRPARAYLDEVLSAWSEISQPFLETECDKILLMCTGKTVTKKILETALPDYMDQGVFRFADRLLDRDAEAVLEAADRVFTDAQSTLKNIGFLASQFRRIKMLKEMQRAGLPPQEKMKRLGVRGSWQMRNIEQAAKKVTEKEAEDFLLALFRFQYTARQGGSEEEIKDVLLRFCVGRG